MNLLELGWNIDFEKEFEKFRHQELSPARIISQHKGKYIISCESGEFSSEVSGKYRYHAITKSAFPTVGDWVAVKLWPDDGKAIIHELLPRKSSFTRKLPISGGRKLQTVEGVEIIDGGSTEEQVIASNIDIVFIVIAMDNNFRPRRIERYLTLAYNSGADPVIMLNKADLCPDVKERVLETESIAVGVPVHPVSALTKEGLDVLRMYLSVGKTAAFLGSSGVGKSTIINSLIGEDRQKVRSLSEATHKGLHTTTHRELILNPLGGVLLDTPGMRELQMWGDEEDLKASFKDIEELFLQCRFSNCAHRAEPGCAVRMALENGDLDPERYSSYLKQRRELRHLERKQKQKARLIEKEMQQRKPGRHIYYNSLKSCFFAKIFHATALFSCSKLTCWNISTAEIIFFPLSVTT